MLNNSIPTYTKGLYIGIFMLISLISCQNILATNLSDLASPTVINYNRKDYNAATQNWAITQDLNNIMWFGNTGRVLWFDGSEWGHVLIPNGSIVRTLKTLNDNSILVGAFGDFGRIFKDENGKYTYESWGHLIPEKHRDYSEVWNIFELNNSIFIQSNQRIFQIIDGKYAGSIEPEIQFRFSFISNGRLYVDEVSKGLKVLLDNELTLVEKGDFFIGKEVWFLGHQRGRLFVGTQRYGAYLFENGKWNKWESEANDFLTSNLLFSGIQLNNESYIFGTIQGGVITCDSRGQINKKINKKRGLQNNTILAMFLDAKENLWLGLDRGIDYVRLNYPFSSIITEEGFGTGYAAIEYKDQLYLGTNQGIYIWSEEKNDFIILPNTTGQVWSFKIIEDALYCFHNNGVYHMENNNASLIFDMEGAWKAELIPHLENTYIIGSYNGLYRAKFGRTPSIEKITGFNESSRVFEFDSQGNIWMSHGYTGVYRIRFSNDYRSCDLAVYFGENQGLPSKINNEVFKFEDEIIIAAEDGFYQYNDIIGLMQKYKKWNEMLPLHHPVTKIAKDPWGRISFFNDANLTWAIINNDTLSYIDSTSFLPLKNDYFEAFENIYYTSKDRAIIGTVDGFSVYDRENRSFQESELPIFIKRVYCIEGSGGNLVRKKLIPKNNRIKIPYSQNTIFIDLSIPVFQNQKDISVSYKINDDIQFIRNNEKQIVLQNMGHGIHHIEIIARDLTMRQTSERLKLTLTIMPPWYKKWYAFVSYTIILIIIISAITLVYKRKVELVKRREKITMARKALQKQQSLRKQTEQAEKELILMKNEKLSSENRLKAEEIANSTMELVHKNKMLLQVKETLTHIQKERDIEIRNSKIKSMLKKIDRDLNNEENWIVFERNFDEVHENFLNRLKEKHQQLTSKDLRLCAYLRMNLSSKEIAPLLRISARSVEISRYRLRKKMDLDRDTNLSDYILSL